MRIALEREGGGLVHSGTTLIACLQASRPFEADAVVVDSLPRRAGTRRIAPKPGADRATGFDNAGFGDVPRRKPQRPIVRFRLA
jgi:hypothetical protein